jgi:hypothetical protein
MDRSDVREIPKAKHASTLPSLTFVGESHPTAAIIAVLQTRIASASEGFGGCAARLQVDDEGRYSAWRGGRLIHRMTVRLEENITPCRPPRAE